MLLISYFLIYLLIQLNFNISIGLINSKLVKNINLLNNKLSNDKILKLSTNQVVNQQLINEFIDLYDQSLDNQTFQSITLLNKPKNELKSISGRKIKLKSDFNIQYTFNYQTNQQFNNYLISESSKQIINYISTYNIQKVILKCFESNNKVVSLDSKIDNKINIYELNLKTNKIIKHTNKLTNNNTINDINLNHNKDKYTYINLADSWLIKLKLLTQEGKPIVSMIDKLKQINRFIEILSNRLVVQENNVPINVLDLGCGLGYLTFALYTYLSRNYGVNSVKVIGIDNRNYLIDKLNGIVNQLDRSYQNLSFLTSNINQLDLIYKENVDILVALHACDTATDDAIWYGISNNASMIITSPCCHKQLRKQIDESQSTHGDQLLDILKYGIYRERYSEIITDTIRGLVLELFGYKVNIIEYVDAEHTSKNSMIIAQLDSNIHRNIDDSVVVQRIQQIININKLTSHRLIEHAGLLSLLQNYDVSFNNEIKSNNKLLIRQKKI